MSGLLQSWDKSQSSGLDSAPCTSRHPPFSHVPSASAALYVLRRDLAGNTWHASKNLAENNIVRNYFQRRWHFEEPATAGAGAAGGSRKPVLTPRLKRQEQKWRYRRLESAGTMKGEVTRAVVLHRHPRNHGENTLSVLSYCLPSRCLLGSSAGRSPGRRRSRESECYSPWRSASQTQSGKG